jgi:hypothetical protein
MQLALTEAETIANKLYIFLHFSSLASHKYTPWIVIKNNVKDKDKTHLMLQSNRTSVTIHTDAAVTL